MNNYINYYYNIYPDSIHEQNKSIYFTYENEKYYFLPYNRPLEDAKYLHELNVEMIRRGSLVHEIILNKDKNVITLVNNVPYVLMRVYINELKNNDLSEIVFISTSNAGIKPNPFLDRSDWIQLWSTKIDYFEYQISQVGKKYPLVCQYLSYYIGMAENAISYTKNTITDVSKSEYDTLTISHKRIKASDTAFEIYNPLSFIIDYTVRDMAEYIKAKFFDNIDVWPELETYFRLYDMSLYSRRLLYARLLFPSYFFDVYEAIIEGKLEEDDILPIVYKTQQYEGFLSEFHAYINKDNLLPKIDWLNKKNSY